MCSFARNQSNQEVHGQTKLNINESKIIIYHTLLLSLNK